MLVLQAHSELEAGRAGELAKALANRCNFCWVRRPRYARIARTARTRAPPLCGARASRV